MTNISQIMKQAKEMQEKMAEMQKKIEETEIEGDLRRTVKVMKLTVNIL